MQWKKIFVTGDPFQAELMKSKLLDQGVECKVLNKKDSAYLFGEIELYVLAESVIRAKHIISKSGSRD